MDKQITVLNVTATTTFMEIVDSAMQLHHDLVEVDSTLAKMLNLKGNSYYEPRTITETEYTESLAEFIQKRQEKDPKGLDALSRPLRALIGEHFNIVHQLETLNQPVIQEVTPNTFPPPPFNINVKTKEPFA